VDQTTRKIPTTRGESAGKTAGTSSAIATQV
jgi:hypothetical protein